MIDDLLREAAFHEFAAACRSLDDEFQVESDDRFEVQFALLDDARLASVFLSIGFAELMHNLTGRWCYPSNGNVQVRRGDTDSATLPVHIDSGGPDSYVALFYTSEDWNATRGGRLRLHRDRESEPTKAIDPIANRLVVFETSSHHWHSVEPINEGTRYSILTEWMVA